MRAPLRGAVDSAAHARVRPRAPGSRLRLPRAPARSGTQDLRSESDRGSGSARSAIIMMSFTGPGSESGEAAPTRGGAAAPPRPRAPPLEFRRKGPGAPEAGGLATGRGSDPPAGSSLVKRGRTLVRQLRVRIRTRLVCLCWAIHWRMSFGWPRPVPTQVQSRPGAASAHRA